MSTFKFPEDLKLRKEWLITMKRESFVPMKESRICADHFTATSGFRNVSGFFILNFSDYIAKKKQYQQFSVSRKEAKCGEELNLPKNKTAACGRSKERVRSAFTNCRKLEVRCCIFINSVTS